MASPRLYSAAVAALLFFVTLMTILNSPLYVNNFQFSNYLTRILTSNDERLSTYIVTPATTYKDSNLYERRLLFKVDGECKDPVWCTIPMPSISHYKFEPPADPHKWRIAQIQASQGEQVLLREVRKVFPTHYDFIDGDITFRKQHLAMDMFVDEIRDLSPLVAKNSWAWTKTKSKAKKLEEAAHPEEEDLLFDLEKAGPAAMVSTTPATDHRQLQITSVKMVRGKLMYPWEAQGKRAIPEPYDFRAAKRAPVVSIGYTAYQRDSQSYFTGNRLGGAFIDRSVFFKYWRKVMHKIDTPFIAVCSLNENWGMLSTKFPNRTAGWGKCCTSKRDQIVFDFLNHDKTLMLVTNQHVNISHPKLMILPRGIPITWGATRMLVWDAQRNVERDHRKSMLLFAAASKWGPRPQILRCISAKFDPKDFDGHVKNPPQHRLDRNEYYIKLGTAMFGVGLPGLGYDTFRMWELMTMGSIVIIEKAVGFDRTLWRLPALLVEDFAYVTPELLREAYLEALYRAKDFEFRRLTQNFWWSVIANVSASMSTQPLLDIMPMEAEDRGFMRPREPFDCWQRGGCGKGTMRIPRQSC